VAPIDYPLHLRLDLLQELRELTLVRALRLPLDTQPVLLIRLWDQMEVYMVDHLMRDPTVVLQDIVILDTLCNRDLLRHREHFRELVVGDIVELCAVVFRDDKLDHQVSDYASTQSISILVLGSTYRVTFAQWANIEKRKCFLALEDLHRRELPYVAVSLERRRYGMVCTFDDPAK
jgi:hypothetical protein